jgi:hypothetical protein
MIAQQSSECGTPAPLWIGYVADIQPMPGYGSSTAEPKRRRVAALQSQALPDRQKQPKADGPSASPKIHPSRYSADAETEMFCRFGLCAFTWILDIPCSILDIQKTA